MRLFPLAILLFGSLAILGPSPAWTQNETASLVRDADLPDAPEASAPGAGAVPPGGASEGQQSPSPHESTSGFSASISSTVLDSSGALVPGAQVIITSNNGLARRVATSGSGGEFTFANLPAGTYKITVSSAGMGAYLSPEIVLSAGEQRQMAPISLNIASGEADVTVTVTEEQLATEQVHAAEQQRVFGVLPNFYSSYDPHPVPLHARQKYQLALRSTTDPVSFATAGFGAGISQAIDQYHGYGQGAEGYAKRYGAAYADDIIDRMLGSAVLPSLLHQDPRYFYKGTGTNKERAIYAIKSAFICKGDNGEWQPNYSHLIGNFAAAGISNLYYPSADRGAGLTLRNGLIDTAGNAGANLLREFILKGITPKANKKDQP